MLVIMTKDKHPDLIALWRNILSVNKIEHKFVTAESMPILTSEDLLFVMGTAHKEVVERCGYIPKKKTTTYLRNKFWPMPNGAKAIFSYSLGVQSSDWSMYQNLLCDCLLAVRYCLTGNEAPVVGDYKWVNNFDDVVRYITDEYARTKKPVPLTCDLETLGLNRYDHEAWIVSIFFTAQRHTAHGLYFNKGEVPTPDVLAQIVWLLNTELVTLRGANFKYDLNWMWEKWKIRCTNFKMDTLLVGSILDENRSNSLNTHAKLLTPMGGYDDFLNENYDKSRMDLIPKDILLTYAGGDTDACLEVSHVMKEQLLEQKRLAKFYVTLLHPAARAYEKVEQAGVPVDLDILLALEEELQTYMLELREKTRLVVGNRLYYKHLSADKDFNLTKASFLTEYFFSPYGLNLRPKMFTEKSDPQDPTPSTALDHLLTFKDVPEAKAMVELLKDYSSASKTLSTYVCKRDSEGVIVSGFLKHLRPDMRFHPTFFLYAGDKDNKDDGGTNTGRLSAKDPAYQCLKGDTLVLTSDGYIPIEAIVAGCEAGKTYTVLTHTGKWKPVIGSYRNGVKKVFSVRLKSGNIVVSTSNHPYLTSRGWITTSDLKIGDTCYALRPQNEKLYQSNVLQLDGHEEQVSVGNIEGLPTVRREGDTDTPCLGDIRQLPTGHGGETSEGVLHREARCEGELRAKQLQMGYGLGASGESEQHQTSDVAMENSDRSSVGKGIQHESGMPPLPPISGYEYGTSLDESAPWERSIFQEVEVVGIDYHSECETFDLTIKDSHSFVANGVIVHNTIPKHTKWAKKLRKAYIAPKGYIIMGRDYSQGELKIAACLAEEPTMLGAYLAGIDLHAVTGAMLGGYTIVEFGELKITNAELFDSLRQLAKAGNFGLLYGMGVEGFMAYAYASFGVVLSYGEAEASRNKFFSTYSALLPWHAKAKNHAKKNKQITSPLGRIRHLPLIDSFNSSVRSGAERQAINSPVQGTLSDMSLWSTAIWDAEGYMESAPVIGMVHDALYFLVPEEEAQFYYQKSGEIMENLPFEQLGWTPQLQFTSDAEFGYNLADMVKAKDGVMPDLETLQKKAGLILPT